MTNYQFSIDDFETELKQHLNLSDSAWLVIDEDIKNFYGAQNRKESFSGFLNTVFQNFYQKADASINLRYMEKADELEKLYSSNEFSSLDKKTIKMFIDKYAKVYEKELQDKALSYPSGEGRKFRIDKESLDILREADEANYYEGSIGKYLKAVFEEYALKPNYIREQIFFKDTFSVINNSIQTQRKLKIALAPNMTKKGTLYVLKCYFSPYKIVQDKTMSYNYLIGYAENIKEKTSTDENGNCVTTTESMPKEIRCLRLAFIEKAKVMSTMGAHISEDKKSLLDDKLNERTAMYMSSECVDVKVIFTDKGLTDFKRQIYMRPQHYEVDSEDNHIYIFQCTEKQAENYFFKMGCDAEIIEPVELHDRLLNRYDKALKTYQDMTQEDIFATQKDAKTKNGN